MSQPLISIIIPLYNAQNYISEAIKSVQNQSYTNWELIIVNDGSTDKSLAVAQKYESEKINIFDISNAGAAAARNYGYHQSSGEYIKFFDADDILSENMLEEQIKLAVLNPKHLISSKWGRFYNDDLSTYNEVPENCWQDLDSLSWIKTSWRQANSMTQPGMFLISKEILRAAGLWNTNLSLIDDFEFFTRVILKAKGVKFCNKAILYYRSGMGATALSGKKSAKHIESAYLSIKLAVNHLLTNDDSSLSKLCSANIWQSFIYEFYTMSPGHVEKAMMEAKILGGSDLPFPSGGITKLISTAFGWKFTKRIKYFFKKY